MVRSRYIPVTSGGHGYWRGRGKHLGLDTISATIYIYISGHGPWTSSRITRYIYQTATGDEGNWPAWTRPDPPFLLFRNIVIFIKFFHGSGVTHIANVCSPGTDAINQVTNIGGGGAERTRGIIESLCKDEIFVGHRSKFGRGFVIDITLLKF